MPRIRNEPHYLSQEEELEARRILLAATISIALVIFCVLLTLVICVRISFVPAILKDSLTS